MRLSARWPAAGGSTSPPPTTRPSAPGATTGSCGTQKEHAPSSRSTTSTRRRGWATRAMLRSTASAAHSTPPPRFAKRASTSSSRRSARVTASRCAGSGCATPSRCSRSWTASAGDWGEPEPGEDRAAVVALLAELHRATPAVAAVAAQRRPGRFPAAGTSRPGLREVDEAVGGRAAVRAGAARARRTGRPTWRSCSRWPTVSPPASPKRGRRVGGHARRAARGPT